MYETGVEEDMMITVATIAPTPEHGGKPLRADARRNREKLLSAAADAFSTHGVEASLEDIARVAGVGIGTLYRNFPTRETLVLGVYQQQVADLETLSVELLGRLAPVDALLEWMRGFVRYAALKRGLVGMLKSMISTDTTIMDTAKATLRGSAQRLLDAAAADRSIRTDIDAPDLLRAIGGVCMASDQPGPVDGRLKLVDLIHDGLRYRA